MLDKIPLGSRLPTIVVFVICGLAVATLIKVVVSPEDQTPTAMDQSPEFASASAHLVESFSIVPRGARDEYLLGEVYGIAYGSGRVYVLDASVPAVRVFDIDGEYLNSIGRRGGGPGEFDDPVDLALDVQSRRIFVREALGLQVHVYDSDGKFLQIIGGHVGGLVRVKRTTMYIGPSGTLFLEYSTFDPVHSRPDAPLFVPVYYQIDSTGALIDTLSVPIRDQRSESVAVTTSSGATRIVTVPFGDRWVWSVLPSGAIVYGHSSNYQLTIRSSTGHSMILRSDVDQARVQPGEARWYRRVLEARFRLRNPGWKWDGGEIPNEKPFFYCIVPDDAGNVWVIRPGRGRQVAESVPLDAPPEDVLAGDCWQEELRADVFETTTGSMVFSVALPEGIILEPAPWIGSGQLLAVFQEGGYPIVRAFRLVR